MSWVKSLEAFLSQWSSSAVRQEYEIAEQTVIHQKAPKRIRTVLSLKLKVLNIIMGALCCVALLVCPVFLLLFIDFKNWKLRIINLFEGWRIGNTSDFHKRLEWHRRQRNNPMRIGTIAYYTRGPYRRRI